MNATKPQSARSAKNPAPASTPGTARLCEAEALKVVPAESAETKDEAFEQHDTIPAPTWFDDGGEPSSSSS